MKKNIIFLFFSLIALQSQAQTYFSEYKGEIRRPLNILSSEIAVRYTLSVYSNDSLVYIVGKENGSNFNSITLNGKDEEMLIDRKNKIIYRISDSTAFKIIPETLRPLNNNSDSSSLFFELNTNNDSLTIELDKRLPAHLLPCVLFTNNRFGVSRISCKRYTVTLSSFAPANFKFSAVLGRAKKICKLENREVHLL